MPLKDPLYRWADRLGLVAAVRDSAWRARRLLILCYHGISQFDEHVWNPSLYLSPQQFRERMRILAAENYNVLPLGTALRLLQLGELPPRSVALTFDDGTADFAQQAVPILQEFNFPATVYLTTYYSKLSLPVFDGALQYVLWRARGSVIDLEPVLGLSRRVGLDSSEGRETVWELVRQHADKAQYSTIEKNDLLRRISDAVGFDYDELARRQIIHIMSADTVRSLPRDLIDVQLHTHRHRTPRNEALFIRELEDNRAELQELLGRDAAFEHFCYPSGDYDGLFLGWLSHCGVSSATTCVPGITDRRSDPLLLPRFVDTSSQSPHAFRAWASGFAALMPSRREHRLDARRLRAPTVSTAPGPDAR